MLGDGAKRGVNWGPLIRDLNESIIKTGLNASEIARASYQMWASAHTGLEDGEVRAPKTDTREGGKPRTDLTDPAETLTGPVMTTVTPGVPMAMDERIPTNWTATNMEIATGPTETIAEMPTVSIAMTNEIPTGAIATSTEIPSVAPTSPIAVEPKNPIGTTLVPAVLGKTQGHIRVHAIPASRDKFPRLLFKARQELVEVRASLGNAVQERERARAEVEHLRTEVDELRERSQVREDELVAALRRSPRLVADASGRAHVIARAAGESGEPKVVVVRLPGYRLNARRD